MSQWHEYIKNDPRWKSCRAVVLDRDDRMCVDCGSEDDLHVDHVTPLVVLFAHGVTEEALAMAMDPDLCATRCRGCNLRKGRTFVAVVPDTWVNPKWAGLGL